MLEKEMLDGDPLDDGTCILLARGMGSMGGCGDQLFLFNG